MEGQQIATLQQVDAGPGRVVLVGRSAAATQIPYDTMLLIEQIEGSDGFALRLVLGDRQVGPGKRAARR